MKTLNQTDAGRQVTVLEIKGGQGLKDRLLSLGIRPGKQIRKISSHFWKGPVTIMIGQARIAIGHGMAEKIMVEE
jgi:ferrous iron transport protein A